MDRREKTLNEVLAKNNVEQQRWELYKRENEEAIENLKMFSKKLTLDVMVPIGLKALIPGQICHTNEVFVSHFQGMFSKCSAFQAQNICMHRINRAKEQLEKLQREQEMFQNKLDIPKFGALPGEGEKEILEEYDEEREKIWREEHKRKVREYKQAERKALEEEIQKSHDNIVDRLEELELMEELDKELEELQVEDDVTLQKIIAGELKLPPEKPRISHYSSKSDVIIGDDKKKESKKEESVVEEISARYTNGIGSDLETRHFTNNNSIPNCQDFHEPASDSDDPSDSEIPDEVLQVEKETLHLSKKGRLKVFKKSLKETEKSLKNLKIANMEDLNRKAHLLEIRECFMDYVEILKDEVEALGESSEEEVNTKQNETHNANLKMKKKKTIKFALKDEIKYIDSNSVEEEKKRDIITLDIPPISGNSKLLQPSETPVFDKRAAILEKVEKSSNFFVENQSQQDFNLVDKILQAENNKEKMLTISFNHSSKKFEYPGYDAESLEQEISSQPIIGSPADIYKFFSKLPDDFELSGNLASTKTTSEEINSNAYEDPRIKILNQQRNDKNKEHNGNEQKLAPEAIKSILKNKDAVKKESHFNEPRKQKKGKKKKSNEDNSVGYDQIIGEVIENPITQPDPLPKENFVDAHAPRKRISRFKQMRATPT